VAVSIISDVCSGVANAERGFAPLARAQYLAGAAQPQILLRYAETVWMSCSNAMSAATGAIHQRSPIGKAVNRSRYCQ